MKPNYLQPLIDRTTELLVGGHRIPTMSMVANRTTGTSLYLELDLNSDWAQVVSTVRLRSAAARIGADVCVTLSETWLPPNDWIVQYAQLELIPPEDIPGMQEALTGIIEQEGTVTFMTYPILRDGEYVRLGDPLKETLPITGPNRAVGPIMGVLCEKEPR